jgi:REP element-mobilizing transposase RayT
MHILISITPTTALSDLVRDIKAVSSKFINESRWIRGKFSWQKGYGAFSCCHSHIDVVKKYIWDQQNHHMHMTFDEEYLKFLKEYLIEYDNKYVFD